MENIFLFELILFFKCYTCYLSPDSDGLCFQLDVVSAKYVMKCDDDTFVRLDSIITEIGNVPSGRSLYMGNINFHHRPLRQGKWAVTYEVNHA